MLNMTIEGRIEMSEKWALVCGASNSNKWANKMQYPGFQKRAKFFDLSSEKLN